MDIDHSNNEQETPVIPTIQDRRQQLEAFQAERARNKSLGGSVRAPIRSNQLGVSQFRHSYRPQRSIGPSGANLGISQGPAAANHEDQTTHFPESNTMRIIQHFDALSRKTDRPVDKTLLGIRRHGAAPHRVEKKSTPGRNSETTTSSLLISRPQRPEPGQGTHLNTEQNVASERNRLGLSRPHTQQTKQASPAIPEARSIERSFAKSVFQERPMLGKSQEEIYLAQAQLLQLYMKQKRLDETFFEQEQTMQTELDAVGNATSAKQAEVHELKEKCNMEQDLVFLEENLGVQKDQLLEVMKGLETYKKRYEDFTLTFEREGRVSGVSGLETGNLDRWLAQTKEFQRAADSVLKARENDRVLVQGIVRTLGGLNSIVKKELEELKECSDLITKISQTEAAEISLSSL
ncbi:hypothetical protein MVEG_00899 [Podila verticillata NRRL 6337]|nr:hypothetical protein MVEG_00899 [Podila verticillata NRRL 6337]